MERFGLVGLPNAGKSSLYNALTGGGALAAPYAFATKDPNIGVAKVPETWIISPTGVVVERFTGQVTAEILGATLEMMSGGAA